jgi:hypothetical protein
MSTFISAISVTPAFLILSCLRARAELSVLHLQEKEREVRIVLNYMYSANKGKPRQKGDARAAYQEERSKSAGRSLRAESAPLGRHFLPWVHPRVLPR